jgi:hypothetical protein
VTHVWARWGHVIIVAVLALPVVAAAAALRARRLGWRAAIAEVGAVAGTLPWLWMVLTPLPQHGEVHLVPFQELSWYLRADTTSMLVQLVGNLAVFAAFGAGAPVRWPLRLPAVAALAALGSAGVESAQYLLDLGRVASVDDVLLNTAGAVLAALATRRWWRVRADHRVRADQRAGGGPGGARSTGRDTHSPGRTGTVGQR